MPDGDRRSRKFVIVKDSVPLGRATRVIGTGFTAHDLDGNQIGPTVSSLYQAGKAVEAELQRRRAAGQIDEITAQANAVAADMELTPHV